MTASTISRPRPGRAARGSLLDKRLDVKIGSGPDEGRLLIAPDPAGRIAARAFLKAGGVSFAVEAWGNLPRAPRPKSPCDYIEAGPDGGAVIRLPSWARPDGKGGKLEKSGVTPLAAEGRKKALGR